MFIPCYNFIIKERLNVNILIKLVCLPTAMFVNKQAVFDKKIQKIDCKHSDHDMFPQHLQQNRVKRKEDKSDHFFNFFFFIFNDDDDDDDDDDVKTDVLSDCPCIWMNCFRRSSHNGIIHPSFPFILRTCEIYRE